MLCVARFIKRAQVSVWAPHSERLLNQFQAPANVRPCYLASSLSLSLFQSLPFCLHKRDSHTHSCVLCTYTPRLPRVLVARTGRRTKMRPGIQLARISMPFATLSDSRCILHPKVICISTPSAICREQVRRDCSWKYLLKRF